MYPSELKFLKLMKSKGLTFIYEPVRFELGSIMMIPDFYCIEENCFYEVIASRSALESKIESIFCLSVFFPKIDIKYVSPNNKPIAIRVKPIERMHLKQYARKSFENYLARQVNMPSAPRKFNKGWSRTLHNEKT